MLDRSDFKLFLLSFVVDTLPCNNYDAKKHVQNKLIWNQFELKSIFNHIQLQMSWMSCNIIKSNNQACSF